MIEIFEALMLICFGISWPFSIYRSWISGRTDGKSFVFLIAVIIGYAAGILNKILTGIDLVIVLYIANLIMVTADALLFIRNKRCARAAGTE